MLPPVPDITVGFVCRKLDRDFGVRLSPEDLHAEMLRHTAGSPERYTCADLLDLLWTRLQHRDAPATLRPLRPTYYRVRAALGLAWQLPWRELRPSATLDQLAGTRHRRKLWRALATELRTSLPDLEIPDRVANGALAGALLVAVLLLYLVLRYAFIPAMLSASSRAGLVLTVLFGLPTLAGVLLIVLTLSLLLCGIPLRFSASAFPFETVRDLVEHLAANAPAQHAHVLHLPWTKELAWFLLRRTLRDSRLHQARRITRTTPLISVLRLHCARCGYDLRSSMYRCPECGTAV